jgi:hypothetical protein
VVEGESEVAVEAKAPPRPEPLVSTGSYMPRRLAARAQVRFNEGTV